MVKLAVFASGSGSNAENLIRYFQNNQFIKVHLVLTNNPSAGVIGRCKLLEVPCKVFSKQQFVEGNSIMTALNEEKIDVIVLAGFLLLVPENIIGRYGNKIINIHPALLPSHGGKGFFGQNVHQSVIDSGTILSGITIHQVNEHFDKGEIIFQAACHVAKDDTAESLAVKIHALEYAYFPVVVEKYIYSLTNASHNL